MVRILVTLVLLQFTFLSYAQSLPESDSLEIIRMIRQQEEDWNKGDLRAFMKGYLPSDKTVFNGASGPYYGYDQILKRYLNSYPDREQMGETRLVVNDLYAINDAAALLLGEFYLTRSSGEISGYFTLVLKKVDGAWYILSDHTSGKKE